MTYRQQSEIVEDDVLPPLLQRIYFEIKEEETVLDYEQVHNSHAEEIGENDRVPDLKNYGEDGYSDDEGEDGDWKDYC